MQIFKVIYAHCKEPGNHGTLLIDTRLKDIPKSAPVTGILVHVPVVSQSLDHTVHILHPACFLPFLMIWGIFPCLKNSFKHHLKWLSMISKPLARPLWRAVSNMGLRFLCAETLPAETSWLPSRDPAVSGQAMGAQLLTVHYPEVSIFSYTISRAKAAFLSQIQMHQVPLGLKHYLLLPNSPNAGVICPVAQDRTGRSSPLSA